MWRAGLLLTLVAVAVAVAGCGDSDPAESAAGPTPAQLDGRAFSSTAVRGHEPVPGSQVTIAFDGERLSARADCNTLTGGWSLDGDRLRTDGDLAQTQMACDEALMRQDEWLGAFLGAAPRIALDGDALTLSGDEATIELREAAPSGPRPIAGTTWRLTEIHDRGGGVSSVPAGVEAPTLLIAEDGTVELFAGCNRGGGRAEVRDDGFVAFGPLALTRKACDEATMRVEAAMTAVLAGRAAAGFSGTGDLSLARDGQSLLFTAS